MPISLSRIFSFIAHTTSASSGSNPSTLVLRIVKSFNVASRWCRCFLATAWLRRKSKCSCRKSFFFLWIILWFWNFALIPAICFDFLSTFSACFAARFALSSPTDHRGRDLFDVIRNLIGVDVEFDVSLCVENVDRTQISRPLRLHIRRCWSLSTIWISS